MSDISQMAERLAEGMLAGAPYDPSFDSADLETAFLVQNAASERLSAQLGAQAGWKIAWNAPHLMEKFAMPHPGMGRVYQAHMREDMSSIDTGDFQNLMLEAEIVARLKTDLGGGGWVTDQAARDAIEGFTVGFEVLDRRGSPPSGTASGILMQNVFNAGAVIGTQWIAPEALRTSDIHTKMTHGDAEIVNGTALTPQDPVEAVAFLANHYGRYDIALRADQVILCGSHIPLYPVTTPGPISLTMSSLGSVGLTITQQS